MLDSPEAFERSVQTEHLQLARLQVKIAQAQLRNSSLGTAFIGFRTTMPGLGFVLGIGGMTWSLWYQMKELEAKLDTMSACLKALEKTKSVPSKDAAKNGGQSPET
jgi:hypothetical protein